jgi:starvation-inducible DNA-binding protein
MLCVMLEHLARGGNPRAMFVQRRVIWMNPNHCNTAVRKILEDKMAKTDAIQSDLRDRNASETPTDLDRKGVTEITNSLHELLADVFAPLCENQEFPLAHERPALSRYHLLLDEQSEQIFAMTDDVAECARKIGGTTIRSIGDIARHQRLKDNAEDFVTPERMLAELCGDNQHLTRLLSSTHELCDRYNDVATAV